MSETSLRGERMLALFALGALALNPPMLSIFDIDSTTTAFGIPLLFVYLFVAWAILITFIAFVIERTPRGVANGSEEETTPPPRG